MPSIIPLQIVDDHNEALNFYYKLIARNKIPFDEMCLIHFDSHPDLASPENISTDQFLDRHHLLDNLTISDWILPAVYQKHFTTIIWIKPPWATQIPLGKHRIQIGKDSNGLLKTSSHLPYYVSDLCFSENLAEAKSFDLFVVEISLEQNNTQECYNLISTILGNRKWCLDIDMDFYSTQNPFKKILGDYFDFVHDIFKFQEGRNLEETLMQRENQLGYLECLCTGYSPSENQINNYQDVAEKLLHQYPSLKDDVSVVKKHVASDEFITDLYYIGQQTELPHHISSDSQIKDLLSKTEMLLKLLSCDFFVNEANHGDTKATFPVAITIAKSEYDEYSAPETLDSIHCGLICLLKRLYNISAEIKCPNME